MWKHVLIRFKATGACLFAFVLLSACSEEAKITGRLAANLAKAKAKGVATLKHDLDRWCKVFIESEKQNFKDDAAQSIWITDQTKEALVTVEGWKMFGELGAVEPGQKWLVVKKAAVKAGLPDWDCPAIRKVLPPPDSNEPM